MLHDRPGQGQFPADLSHRAPAVTDRGPRCLAQGHGGTPPWRHLGYRLGERATRVRGFGAVPACLAPLDTHGASAARQVPGPGGAVDLQSGGEDPAGRTGPGEVLGGDHIPHRSSRPVVLDLRHTHPFQPQKLSCRLVNFGMFHPQYSTWRSRCCTRCLTKAAVSVDVGRPIRCNAGAAQLMAEDRTVNRVKHSCLQWCYCLYGTGRRPPRCSVMIALAAVLDE